MNIDPERVIFAVPSNQSDMGSVDETGLFTAGEKPGKATVTAALRNDPLGRKASITISVVPTQAHSLVLMPALGDLGQVAQEGENTTVIFTKADVVNGYSFDLSAEAKDADGNALVGKTVSFSSTDATIAKVTKEGRVTLAKGAERPVCHRGQGGGRSGRNGPGMGVRPEL